MRPVAGFLLVLLVLGMSHSADAFQARKYKKGDRVQVEVAGEYFTGEVVGFGANGWISVKYRTKNGVEKSPTFPPNRVFPPGAKLPKSDGGKDDPDSDGSPSTGTRSGALRTWSDRSGKFSIKARFVELNGDEVTLEKEDGKTVSIPLDKLKDADRKLAKELASGEDEEDPFKPKSENPFKQKSQRDDDNDDEAAEAEVVVSDVDWSGVETVDFGDPPLWSLKPDGATMPEKPLVKKPVMLFSAVKARNVELGFFNNVEGLLLDESRGVACVIQVDGTPGKPSTVALQRADLVTGKAQPPVVLPAPLRPYDMDPTGERIVAGQNIHITRGKTEPQISVWEFGEKTMKHVRTWDAHDPADFHNVAPSTAQFLDSDHVLTFSFPSKVVVFDVNTAKAVYRFEVSSIGPPVVSPGRKYLAVSTKSGIVMLDAPTGKPVAKLAGDPGWVSSMSFHPSGRWFAALSSQRLVVWDLESGEIYRDIYFSTPVSTSEIDWVADGYVLLGSAQLVDLERRIVLWHYQCDVRSTISRSYGAMGGTFWYALTSQDRKERGLFSVVIPHEEARRTAAELKAEELLALRPGGQITLQVNVQGAPADVQKAGQDLSAQLQRIGMTVVNNSRLVLQATTETGKTDQITYSAFGAGRGAGTTVSVTSQISRVRLTEDGKVIWEASGVFGAPHILHLKQGESIQQALAPYQVPNLRYFSDVKLPEYIARPHPSGAYGASTISHRGIQSAPLPQPQQQPQARAAGM